jgi:hypothetical protein
MYWVGFGGGTYLGSSRRMPVQNDIIFGSFQVELVRFSTDFDNFFIVLSLSTNFSLEVSFFVYKSTGNRIGWSTFE